jgi:hypothetical protein
MAAQALCEPAEEDATDSVAKYQNLFFIGVSQRIKYREYVLLIIWPQLTFSAMEYSGS